MRRTDLERLEGVRRWCQGTNKSRSHAFNADPTKNFLKCTVCNQNGLERCDKC